MIKFMLQRDLLDEPYLNTFARAPVHKVFPHPVCLAIYLNNVGFKTETIKFIKCNFNCSVLNTVFTRLELTKNIFELY